jgi:hypothetical protein
VGNFITDAMVILLYLKIPHEKTNFGKFTISWEYFHGNGYYGKIPMYIWHYALRWGETGKNCSIIQQSWWSSG